MNDDKAAAALAHFQAAAIELIRASRSLLDVAEELVSDPSVLANVVATATQAAAAVVSQLRPTGASGGEAGHAADGSRVEHIRVS